MKKWFVISLMLLLFTISADLTAAKKLAPAKQPAQLGSRSAQAENKADGNQAFQPTTQPTSHATAMIIIVDTSKSVLREFEQIKNLAKKIIDMASGQTALGVVGIDLEARKEIFSDRRSAFSFIDSLTPDGAYTDFNRGSDAALSLLQRIGPKKSVLILLTDGKQDVPKAFKDRADFLQVLNREFANRPEIKAIVINVNPRQALDQTRIAPNISIIPFHNWEEALKEIEAPLAPQIAAHLEELPPSADLALPPPPPSLMRRLLNSPYVLALIPISVIVLTLLLRWRKRNRALSESTVVKAAKPENILTPDGRTRETEMASEVISVIDIVNQANSVDQCFSKRVCLRKGESLRIGGSRFAGGVPLTGLKQSETIKFVFDGSALVAFRLNPDRFGESDLVMIDNTEAPVQFVVTCDTELVIEDYTFSFNFADESYLSLVDTDGGSIAGMMDSANRAPTLRRGNRTTQRRR